MEAWASSSPKPQYGYCQGRESERASGRMDDEAHCRALCERLRAYWLGHGQTFTYSPATEEQVRSTEAQLGFALPLLLRLLYREVANGGNGLVWYDEQFPLIGVQGGCPFPPLGWPDAGPWRVGATIGELVSRSGWQLHPCVAAALHRHPHCYVLCDQPPDRFVTLSFESPGVAVLDPVSGHIYQLTYEGDLLLDNNQTQPVMSLQSYKWSLETWLEEWFAFLGCGSGITASAGGGVSRDTLPNAPAPPPVRRSELTPDLLDPACAADPALVWHGLYRGVATLLDPEPPASDDNPIM